MELRILHLHALLHHQNFIVPEISLGRPWGAALGIWSRQSEESTNGEGGKRKSAEMAVGDQVRQTKGNAGRAVSLNCRLRDSGEFEVKNG